MKPDDLAQARLVLGDNGFELLAAAGTNLARYSLTFADERELVAEGVLDVLRSIALRYAKAGGMKPRSARQLADYKAIIIAHFVGEELLRIAASQNAPEGAVLQ